MFKKLYVDLSLTIKFERTSLKVYIQPSLQQSALKGFMLTSLTMPIPEIETQSSTTYSTGQDVMLSCVFDFTKGGTGPTSVEWTQIDGLTMATDYLVDLGNET